jgi:hypothetical protein
VTDQADTRLTTTRAIMRDPAFAAGVSDVRNGVPFDYNHLNSWEYELGRLWAYLAPTTMPLKIKGKLNPKAIALCDLAFKRKYLI